MDHAVALVEAYLRVNGYLTVAEYPVLDAPRHGEVIAPAGHSVRTVAFGNPHGSATSGHWRTVSLDHVIGYPQDHPRARWDQIGHSQLKDPTLGLLALMEKSARAGHHTQAPR